LKNNKINSWHNNIINTKRTSLIKFMKGCEYMVRMLDKRFERELKILSVDIKSSIEKNIEKINKFIQAQFNA